MNNHLIIFAVLMILLNLSRCSSSTPDCSSYDGYYPVFVSDTANCHNYYICYGEGNSSASMVCEDNGCFNDVISSCLTASNDHCSNCQETSPATSIPTPAETTTIPPASKTSTSILATTTEITTTTPKQNTSTPIPTTTTVTTTEKPVTCGGYAVGSLKPDPTDCRKYFMCTSTGQWLLLPCSGGGCFVEDLGDCIEIPEFCTSYCGDTPLPGTTTTITSTVKTTTAKTTTTSGCFDVSNYECPRDGYFAKCKYCVQEYFSCSGTGKTPLEEKCPGSTMFNPDPSFPYCITSENCPSSPNSPTTTSQPILGCISASDFQCPGNGFYAKCDYCVPDYFCCNHTGETPTTGKCPDSLMFNPDPKFPYCVQPYNCPFSE